MKKCRDVNKAGTDLPFIPTDDIESDDLSINEEEKEDKSEINEKSNIEKLIKINNIEEELESVSDLSEFNNF